MTKLKRPEAYGSTAVALLAGVAPYLDAITGRFVAKFYADLVAQPGPATLLSRLTAEEFAHLQAKQVAHLQRLFDPSLDESTHRRVARRVGRIHAYIGVEPGWIVDAYEHYRHLVLDLCPVKKREYRAFRDLLDQRLNIDLHEQLDGPREMAQLQATALMRIDQLIATATTFVDLASGVLDILMTLEGLEIAAISRPDAEGNLQYEVTVGDKAQRYLGLLATGWARPISIHADDPTGCGPGGRAWRSGMVEQTLSSALDPGMAAWHGLLSELNLRSAATIPMLDNDERPQMLLHLWSAWPGHFATPTRETLIEHLQRVLGPAFGRLNQQSLVVIPQGRRLAWRELLQHGGLEMQYQPIVNLASGALHKVEALARLRGADGDLVAPAEFLPAFGEWELRRLFALGLEQALTALHEWDARGVVTTVSINLPPQGLKDRSYIEILRETLHRTHADPKRLTLELLESGRVENLRMQADVVDELRAIGIRLAEDDLGSGYSSLLRMESIAFDEMKIDQGLVSNSTQTPRKALGFIHYLTRLSHDFGIPVTVEGLENHGLVEAAVILAANTGQGFSIAHPMSIVDIPAWRRNFRLTIDQTQPKTALGAFATSMLWHMQMVSLSPWPELLENFLRMPCSLSYYIRNQGLRGTSFDEAYETLHAVALQGPSDSRYWDARERMERLLAERITLENA